LADFHHAQLLSEDSLRRTGYFDVSEVTRWLAQRLS
jgi:hypothetical protein